jgi:hypothetical protein
MKYAFIVAFAFCVAELNAQITITSADMPGAGDSVRLSYANGTNNIDHTLTGANYLWDFSTLTPIAQERIDFNQPSAFPFAFMSDVAVTNYSPDTLPVIGTIPSNFTDYFKVGNSSYRQIGLSFEFASLIPIPIPVIFSAGDTVYRFPLNYGNIDSCDAKYGFSIPGIGYLGQDRHRVNVVDGWGTLITPLDTYNVVRVRSVVNAVDTIALDTTNQTGFTLVRPTEVQYKWLANGLVHPVLEVDCQVIANAEVVTNVAFQDSLIDGLFQVSVAENSSPVSAVYPNPTAGSLSIKLNSNMAEPPVIEAYNAQGQQVSVTCQRVDAFTYFVDVQHLPLGCYWFKVITSDGVSCIPVVRN